MTEKPRSDRSRRRRSDAKKHGGDVLAQVRFFGLTTLSVVAKNFCSGDRRTARRLVGRLLGQRELYRHEESGCAYFTRSADPLRSTQVVTRFSILCYCRMREMPETLLSPSDLRKFLSELRAIVRFDNLPAFRPCIRKKDRLSLIEVHPPRFASKPDGLNAALGRLQTLAGTPAFIAWWHFARHGLFELVYLMSESSAADELTRWIARHPILSNVGGSAVPVPIRTVVVPPFAATP